MSGGICPRGNVRIPYILCNNLLVLQVVGRLPFDDTNHKRLLRLILQGPTFPVNRDASQEFQDLVTSILKRESLRVGFPEIRNSPWFTQNAFSAV